MGPRGLRLHLPPPGLCMLCISQPPPWPKCVSCQANITFTWGELNMPMSPFGQLIKTTSITLRTSTIPSQVRHYNSAAVVFQFCSLLLLLFRPCLWPSSNIGLGCTWRPLNRSRLTHRIKANWRGSRKCPV